MFALLRPPPPASGREVSISTKTERWKFDLASSAEFEGQRVLTVWVQPRQELEEMEAKEEALIAPTVSEKFGPYILVDLLFLDYH